MKYIGALYIFWLAWHIFKSKPGNILENSPKELTFLYGFIAQFVNVKVMLYGMVSIQHLYCHILNLPYLFFYLFLECLF